MSIIERILAAAGALALLAAPAAVARRLGRHAVLAGEVTPDANRAAWITAITALLVRAGLEEHSAAVTATNLTDGRWTIDLTEKLGLLLWGSQWMKNLPPSSPHDLMPS